MRKVLGQEPGLDRGPTEDRLREWLTRDPKGYVAAVEGREKREGAEPEAEVQALQEQVRILQARVAELEAAQAKSAKVADLGPDAGSERAKALIQRILQEHGV